LQDYTACAGKFSAINTTLWNGSNRETLLGAGGNFSNPGDILNGTLDHVVIWNRSLSFAEVSDLFELSKTEYYWNLTVIEPYKPEFNSTNGTNEFKLGCNINCSLNKVYNSLFNCGGENVTFIGSDRTIDYTIIDTNMTNYGHWEIEECRVIGIENFKG